MYERTKEEVTEETIIKEREAMKVAMVESRNGLTKARYFAMHRQ
jgi:hypothetical protein